MVYRIERRLELDDDGFYKFVDRDRPTPDTYVIGIKEFWGKECNRSGQETTR